MSLTEPCGYESRCLGPCNECAADVARAICTAAIEKAVHDLGILIYGFQDKGDRVEAARDLDSAIRFFTDRESNFRWMAAGLDLNVQEVLRALAPRIAEARTRLRLWAEDFGTPVLLIRQSAWDIRSREPRGAA